MAAGEVTNMGNFAFPSPPGQLIAEAGSSNKRIFQTIRGTGTSIGLRTRDEDPRFFSTDPDPT